MQESTGGETSDQLWFTLRRAFLSMVSDQVIGIDSCSSYLGYDRIVRIWLTWPSLRLGAVWRYSVTKASNSSLYTSTRVSLYSNDLTARDESSSSYSNSRNLSTTAYFSYFLPSFTMSAGDVQMFVCFPRKNYFADLPPSHSAPNLKGSSNPTNVKLNKTSCQLTQDKVGNSYTHVSI